MQGALGSCKTFFWPRRLPKSAREAIWEPFLSSQRGLGLHLVLGAVLVLKNEPRERPGTFKNDAPVEAGAQILIFRGFRPRAQKRAKKEPPGRPKWSSNRPPEPLGRVKSRWEILPEALRKFTMNFFRLRRPPGAIWEPPGRAKKGFHVALLVFSASGRLRGAILEPCWLDFWSVVWNVFEAILK